MDKIEIIGTSHIAQQSINALRRKIRFEKPDIVAVELDAVRLQDLLYSSKRRKIRIRDIRHIGLFGWLFAFIGAFIQKRLGKKAGAVPGSDMKAAVISAREIGSQVALIDRNISLTIRKMSKEVPLKEKFYLVWFIFFGWLFDPKETERLSKIDLKKVPGPAVVQALILDFRHKFPNIYRVLVTERDLYMVRKIRFLRKRFPEARILVVVGAGHVKGLKKLLEHSNK